MTNKTENTPKKLKKYRLDAGFTIYSLADRVGVHYSSVSGWENGLKKPRMDRLELLEDLLGHNHRELFADMSEEEIKEVEERMRQNQFKKVED